VLAFLEAFYNNFRVLFEIHAQMLRRLYKLEVLQIDGVKVIKEQIIFARELKGHLREITRFSLKVQER
jgi:hypothetical protein